MAILESGVTEAGSAYPGVLRFCSWHSPQRHPHTQSRKKGDEYEDVYGNFPCVGGGGGLIPRRLDGKVKCTCCGSNILAVLFR